MSAFNLIEGLITLLDEDRLKKLSSLLMPVLLREMSDEDQNIDADLKQAALRVSSLLRKRIGNLLYDYHRSRLKLNTATKRAQRKKVLALEKVRDPVRATKRKAAAQVRKKSAKKLKMNVMRGKVADVKGKLRNRKRKATDDAF